MILILLATKKEKWDSKNFVNKNSKHIAKLMDKYKLNLPCHKPTSQPLSNNIEIKILKLPYKTRTN